MPEVPPCAGTYETGSSVCNGDPAGASAMERVPCAWRQRCRGLQRYCKSSSQHAADLIAGLPFTTLVALCEEYRTPAAGVPPPQPKPARKTPTRKRSTRSTRDRRPAKLTPEIIALVDAFEHTLRSVFAGHKFARGSRVAAKPGTFYRRDNTRAVTNFVSWYCVTATGTHQMVATLRLKPRLGAAHLFLPVTVQDMQAFLNPPTMRRLHPAEHLDGQIRSVCKGVDIDAVGVAVSAIATLAHADVIPIPE